MTDHHESDAADERLCRAAAAGCGESRMLLSRRNLLGLGATLFTWGMMPKLASAATRDPRLLVVVLRGGMDGLSTVVPYDFGQLYEEQRRALAMDGASLIKIKGTKFRFHPALTTFNDMFVAGDASVVHATCVPLRTRSHFDCQDNLENGLPGSVVSNSTGWLNRLLDRMPSSDAPWTRRSAIEIGQAPLLMRGPAEVIGWTPSQLKMLEDPTTFLVEMLYNDRDKQLYDALKAGQRGRQLAGAAGDPKESDVVLKAFSGAGRLLGAADGPRVASLSILNWDTHTGQGDKEDPFKGAFGDRLKLLDDGLKLFKQTLDGANAAAWNETVVMFVTEFGRTVLDNGNLGSDHGIGGVALLAGGAVKGGQLVMDWPGIRPKDLVDGRDLKATIDLRRIFKGVLADHLQVPQRILDTRIFPDSAKERAWDGLIA